MVDEYSPITEMHVDNWKTFPSLGSVYWTQTGREQDRVIIVLCKLISFLYSESMFLWDWHRDSDDPCTVSVDVTLPGQVNVNLSSYPCVSTFPWPCITSGGGHCWVCGDQPVIKCNCRAKMLIIGPTLPSSFPVGLVSRWAVGVTVSLNHCCL